MFWMHRLEEDLGFLIIWQNKGCYILLYSSM